MHAFVTRAVALIPKLFVLVAASVFVAASARAVPITVNFDNDDTSTPNPGQTFTSVDSSLVHFSDTDGVDLFLADAGISPNGSNALAVFSDDDNSALRIDFDFTADMLSLDFGTGAVSSNPATAVLTVFANGLQVDQIAIALIQNGTLGQTLLYDTGLYFDAVEFEFVNPGLTEIVDNVTVNPIPEPAAAVAFGLGLIVAGTACRRGTRSRQTEPMQPQ